MSGKSLGYSVGKRAVDSKALDSEQQPVPLGDIVGEGASVGAEQTTGEIGGPKGLEPTRYGDWERKGRCVDF